LTFFLRVFLKKEKKKKKKRKERKEKKEKKRKKRKKSKWKEKTSKFKPGDQILIEGWGSSFQSSKAVSSRYKVKFFVSINQNNSPLVFCEIWGSLYFFATKTVVGGSVQIRLKFASDFEDSLTHEEVWICFDVSDFGGENGWKEFWQSFKPLNELWFWLMSLDLTIGTGWDILDFLRIAFQSIFLTLR